MLKYVEKVLKDLMCKGYSETGTDAAETQYLTRDIQ